MNGTLQSASPNDKPLWGIGEVLSLSWPASLSMLNSTLMRFVDGLMVSLLGPDVMGAQFLAGLCSFVPESFAAGIVSVVNTYVSQNFGATRFRRCGQYAWAGVFLALLFSAMIMPLGALARPIFQGLLHQPPQLVENEVMYFRYMVVAVLVTLTARPLEQFFYGIHRPRIVLVGSTVSQITNLVLGWILIFGDSGGKQLSWLGPLYEAWPLKHIWFAGMGLRGAAIAAIASWALYLVILIVVFMTFKEWRKFGTRLVRTVKLRQFIDIIRIGWPAGVQFISDLLPWAVFSTSIVASFTSDPLTRAMHIEAGVAAMRWMSLSFTPAVGIGVAATALVGRYIGQGRPDLARRRAHGALCVAMAYMGLCAVAFLIFRHEMIRIFISIPGDNGLSAAQNAATAAEMIRIGGYIMICAAIFQVSDAVGIVFCGALRGAGDTLWPMIFTFILGWGLTVVGAYEMTQWFPQLTSIGPWMAATAYVVVLGILVAWRFESGKWRKIQLLDRPEHQRGR
jgi:MATE family multidrug resistance protein